MMIDTQVLSYCYKGKGPSIYGSKISSVVATEFLEMYDSDSPTKFKYYVLYRPYHFGLMQRAAPSTHKSHAVDNISFNFSGDYPPLIEFCSRDVASIINRRDKDAYAGVLKSLDKIDRKRLKPRFKFLCMNVSECIPLTPETAAVGAELLFSFTKENNLKSKFRNSVNDMMILAAAITSKERLLTQDNLLARFAAKQQSAAVGIAGQGYITIDFSESKNDVGLTRESKGYIHRGWTIAERTRRSNVPQNTK